MATMKRKASTIEKRTRLRNKAGTFFAKRTKSGQLKELDERGRSQRADRAKRAKTKTRSGYGDQGDRRSR